MRAQQLTPDEAVETVLAAYDEERERLTTAPAHEAVTAATAVRLGVSLATVDKALEVRRLDAERATL